MALPVWQATVVRDNGDVVPNAEVSVVLESTGLGATIYSDRTGATQLTAPYFADSDGFFQFYADAGDYRITASDSGTGFTRVWRYVSLFSPDADISTSTGTQTLAVALDDRVIRVGSVADLAGIGKVSGADYHVGEFWNNTGLGGGIFTWDASLDKTNHDGIVTIDPNRLGELDQSLKVFNFYFSATSTAGSLGCFVRRYEGFISVLWAGARAGGTDATPSAQACSDKGYKQIQFPAVDGDYYVEGFKPASGVRVFGKGTVRTITGQSFPADVCVRSKDDQQPMRIMFEDVATTWEEFAAIRALGYNTLMHYMFSDVQDIIFSAEAAGLDIVIRSATDTPTLPQLYDQRPSVIGYYLYDEPEFSGDTVADQNIRISAHRALTNKMLMVSTAQDASINVQNISTSFDVIMLNIYFQSLSGYGGANASQDMAIYAINLITQYQTLNPRAKIVPNLGLFTGVAGSGTTFTTDPSQAARFARDLARTSEDGTIACFIFNGATDPTNIDDTVRGNSILRDAARESVRWASVWPKIRVNSLVFPNLGTPSQGLSGITKKQAYGSSPDILPFRVVNTGGATERENTFDQAGLAIRNGGGSYFLDIDAIEMAGLCYIVGGVTNKLSLTDITVAPVYTVDDGYTETAFGPSATVSTATGSVIIPFIGAQVGGSGYTPGIRMTDVSPNGNAWRFLNGALIYSNWPNNTY